MSLCAHVRAQVAIKFLERGPGVNKSVLREILNHRLCVVHPNIVQVPFSTGPRHHQLPLKRQALPLPCSCMQARSMLFWIFP